LALAALALVVFGAYDSYPMKESRTMKILPFELAVYTVRAYSWNYLHIIGGMQLRS